MNHPRFPDTLAPFVPTPFDVVDRMLALADVTAADTVFDLGCGDGRVVIAAARNFGARGVGFDIQPGLMEMTQAGIDAAGVGHLVEFRLQDAMTVDLRPASVIALYLMDWSNARFQTIIQRSCKLGTRVVSHTFPMPDWLPVKVESFADSEGMAHTLYLWKLT